MNRKKQAIALFLCLSLLVGILLVPNESSAATSPVVEQMDISSYRAKNAEGYYSDNLPTKTGYIFAGFFTDAACTTGIGTDKTSGTYYAKFVPAEVLWLKAQLSANLSDSSTSNDETASIRFVTSVDSMRYSEVGFEFTINGATERKGSSEVYRSLYAVGSTTGTTVQYKPYEIFSPQSTHFKTWTFTDIPSTDYGVDITVKTYWITLDGSMVYGTETVKNINGGIWATSLRKSTSHTFNSSSALLDSLTPKYAKAVITSISNGYSGSIQGGYSNGTEFLQAFISRPYTITTDGTTYDEANNLVTIRKYGLTTGEQKGGQEYDPSTKDEDMTLTSSLNHANDITYDSKNNRYVVVHAAPNYTIISFFDETGTEFIGQKQIDKEIISIAYHAPTERYVVGLRNKVTFQILDADFNTIDESFAGASSATSQFPIKHYATQGVSCDDNFIYFVRSGKTCSTTDCTCNDGLGGETFPNIITVYDWSGAFVTVIDINSIISTEDRYEPENISVIEDKIHLGVMNWDTYKWSVYELSGLN